MKSEYSRIYFKVNQKGPSRIDRGVNKDNYAIQPAEINRLLRLTVKLASCEPGRLICQPVICDSVAYTVDYQR